MKLNTFFNNFDRFADSALGIPLLRQTILQFAVQGRLVKQSADDTPADVIIQRLLRARRQSGGVASSNVQGNGQNGAQCSSDIPSGWSMCLVEDAFNVTDYVANGSFESLKQNVRATNEIDYAVLVRTTDGVNDWKGPFRYVDKSSFDFLSKSEVRPGDIIISSVGNPGQVFTVPDLGKPMTIGPNAVLVIPRDEEILRSYLSVFFRSPFAQSIFRTLSAGTAVQKFSKTVFRASPFLLPPLAEQKRIVAKVDELMALCDRLEAQQQEREEQASQLARASLARFAEAPTPANLSYLFHSSFIIPPSSLRKSIHTLAVQGKLVPQDPNDEPAEELVARVAAEKLRLVQAKEIKTETPLDPISDEEALFPIPDSWIWLRAGDLCRPISSGSTPDQSVFHASEGIPYLKVYNIRNQTVDFDYKRQFIAANYHEERMKRSILRPGDVIMNIVGPPLGKVAIVPDTFPEWNCNQAISFFRPIFPEFSSYLYTFLKEGSFLQNIQLIGTAGQDNISVTKCKFIPVPIPPLAEQSRIVAKVAELMTLVDQMERQIDTSSIIAKNLLEALVTELAGPRQSK
jgi:type I restriction enzyme S subunit